MNNDYDVSINDFMMKYELFDISINDLYSYLNKWWYRWYCELLKCGYYSKNRKYTNCDDIVALAVHEYIQSNK